MPTPETGERLGYPPSAIEAIESLKKEGRYCQEVSYKKEEIEVRIFLGVEKDKNKKTSQDAACHAVYPGGNLLFGVLDGVSKPGDKKADSSFAAWHAAEWLKKIPLLTAQDIDEILKISDDEKRKEELKKRIQDNLQIVQKKLPEGRIGETTLSYAEIVQIKGKRYLVGVNIGDSRVYLGKEQMNVEDTDQGQVLGYEESVKLEQLTLDDWSGWEAADLAQISFEDKLEIQKILSNIEDYSNVSSVTVNALQGILEQCGIANPSRAQELIDSYAKTRDVISKSFHRGLSQEQLGAYAQVFMRELESGDMVIATTDGIHDVLTDKEMEKVLSKALKENKNPSQALIEAASKKTGPRSKEDDRAAVVAMLGEGGSEAVRGGLEEGPPGAEEGPSEPEEGPSEPEEGPPGANAETEVEGSSVTSAEAAIGGTLFTIGLLNVFDRLLNPLNLDAETRKNLKKSIAEAIKNRTEGLLDEDKVVTAIEEAVSASELGGEQKEQILKSLIEIDEKGIKKLKANALAELEAIFRQHGRGKNERVEAENAKEVKAYLYLLLPEGAAPADFKNAFTELVTQRSGSQLVLKLFPPRLRRVPAVDKAVDFMAVLTDHLEALRQDKDQITVWFNASLAGQIPEEFLSNSNVVTKKGNVYEMYITPDKYLQIMQRLIQALVGVEKVEIELAELFPQAAELLKQVEKKFKDSPYLPQITTGIRFLLEVLEKQYKEKQQAGASEADLGAIKKGVEDVIGMLKGVVGEEKKEKKEKAVGRIREWLKANAGTIIPLLGTWALMWAAVFAFYLPVLIISKAEQQIGGLGIKV